ncbi:MAG: hypothetical protein DHS20C16_15550 [Phycisphaerae bacterium]|nr:MAG: hypothetical protein DHS20C16_15550 [Phycisphaerae bacterium]
MNIPQEVFGDTEQLELEQLNRKTQAPATTSREALEYCALKIGNCNRALFKAALDKQDTDALVLTTELAGWVDRLRGGCGYLTIEERNEYKNMLAAGDVYYELPEELRATT